MKTAGPNSLSTTRPKRARREKELFELLASRGTNFENLKPVVVWLAKDGVQRPQLVAWAIEHGKYERTTASSLISRLLCKEGVRVRQKGGGRKPSRIGLEMLAIARARFGAGAERAMRAGLRAAKYDPGAYCGPSISSSTASYTAEVRGVEMEARAA